MFLYIKKIPKSRPKHLPASIPSSWPLPTRKQHKRTLVKVPKRQTRKKKQIKIKNLPKVTEETGLYTVAEIVLKNKSKRTLFNVLKKQISKKKQDKTKIKLKNIKHSPNPIPKLPFTEE